MTPEQREIIAIARSIPYSGWQITDHGFLAEYNGTTIEVYRRTQIGYGEHADHDYYGIRVEGESVLEDPEPRGTLWEIIGAVTVGWTSLIVPQTAHDLYPKLWSHFGPEIARDKERRRRETEREQEDQERRRHEEALRRLRGR